MKSSSILLLLALGIGFVSAAPAATTTTTKTSSTKTTKTSSTKTSSTKTTKTSTTKTTSTKTSSTKTSSTKTSSTKTTTSSGAAGTGTSCTVTAYADVAAATASCTAITLQDISVPASTTLNLAKLKQGTILTFAGTTTFAYGDFSGDLIDIGGVDITITSAPGAIIDGNGQAWWDGQGSNGGITKPDHFIVLKTTGTSLVENLHIQNWPVHCWEVTSASGTTITGLTMDNSAGNAPNAKSSGLPAAHNSDGFDVSGSTDIIIENTTVINQDDCVAVTSGTGITIQNMVCDGGHGLSIGSIGGKSKNDVANVLFTNSVVKNSQNGARIKTNSGTTGTVTNVTWSNIQVENISIYGIDIQQDYLNGGPTGTPTNGVTITGITMSNITGTTQSSAQNYYILCGSGSCTNFDFENVSITGGTDDSCNYTPTEGNFVCN